jgi:hypothetical protein
VKSEEHSYMKSKNPRKICPIANELLKLEAFQVFVEKG